MSSSGDPGQAPGQDSPVSAVGAWSLEARGGNGVTPGVGFPQIEVAGVAGPEVALESGPPGMEVALESGLPEMEVALECGPPRMEVALESGPPGMEVALESAPPGMEVALESGPPGMEVALESGPPGMEVALESGPPVMEVALESGPPGMEVALESGPPGMEVALESGPPGMEVALESGSPGMEVALESGPPEMEVALHSGLPPMEVSEVEGPVGGPGEAALGLGLAGGPAGMSVEAEEDDSDFGPAEEDGEEQQEEGLDILVDAHQFPMVGFRFMFLDLVHSLLHRIYHNNHILVRPRRGRVMVWPRARQPDGHPTAPAGPPAWAAPAAARESEASSEEEAAWETAEEPDEESEEGPETAKGTTKFQYEKPAKGANDSEREEEKDKFNKKQEGAD
ncbi:cancer/testis antigen 47A-like isoform X2 [Mustela erminea]|uniref:cancer/testis antigen 47A-like isoform X2 n=1 Tax=Mustela erminea TaxID=36723 RepID=UPI00138728BE|nr:cancer/testis antigen 47A-like isoform X2 [Mustela erminea]